MRKNNGRRRVRGQNRRNYNNINKNTVLESCGPISQIRGNVQQLNEKYNSLGNDAAANDDKVLSESYFQFADHYHRLLKELELAQETKTSDLNNSKGTEDYLNQESRDTSLASNGKPSRKERSIQAKAQEKEQELTKEIQNKLPKKFSNNDELKVSKIN